MNEELNTETVILPQKQLKKSFYKITEFAEIAEVSIATVYDWGNKGFLDLKQFSPRCRMVPGSEVERYLRGEMMEPRT